MTGQNARPEKPDMDELNEEIERLRAEKEALQKELAEQEKKRKGFPWRNFLVWVLVIIACITAAAGSIALWVKATALDTDRYVEAVAPLSSNEDVAQALSELAVTRLFEELDVSDRISRVMPEEIEFLSEPLTNVLEESAEDVAKSIITSSQFEWVWEKINRLAHSTAVGIIEGDKSVEFTSEGEVVLDLGDLLESVRDALVDAGIDLFKDLKIPDDAGQVVLFKSEQLGALKSTVDILDTLGWILPFLSLIFFATAVVISRDRRKAFLIVGTGLAIAMGISLVAMDLSRAQVLGQVKNETMEAAAAAVWDTVFRGLTALNVSLLILGALIALVSAVAGPYRWAVRLRRKTGGLFERRRIRRGEGKEQESAFATFVESQKWVLRIGGVVAAFIVLLAWPLITPLVIMITAAVLLVYLVAIELVRGGPAEEAPPQQSEAEDTEKPRDDR